MRDDDRLRISVCVVCRNEADKLPDCLRSASFADEIVVMDLSSEDGSAAVAAEHGARVVRHEPVPIVELVRNKVAAEATGTWVLALDPDERVSPGLAAELRRLSGLDGFDAVSIPRLNRDFGYAAETPLQRYEPQTRFYRRERVTWPTEPNELPAIGRDRLHRLPQRDELVIVHDRNRSIPEALERVIRYAPAEAAALLASGETFTARKMIRRVAGKTHKQFVEARSLEEGMPGLLRAFVLVSFHFHVWACFWQLSGAHRTKADDRYLRRLGLPLRLLRALGAPAKARRLVRRHLRAR